jgi:plastocyanin
MITRRDVRPGVEVQLSTLVMLLLLLPAVSCAPARTLILPFSAPAQDNLDVVANPGQNYQVIIQGGAFIPREIAVNPGDTVTWVNQDARTYTVTSMRNFQDEDDISHVYIGEAFDSGDIMPGHSWARTFPEAGAYEYFSLPMLKALPIPQYEQFRSDTITGMIVVD